MRLAATLAVLTLIWAAATPAAAAPASVPLAGTFSNLEFNEEGGDLLGMELKIVPWTAKHHRAAVLVSEGSPSRMVIVDVTVDDGIVRFTVPATDQDSDDGFEFRGRVTKLNLTGTITYASGAKEQVKLPRRCGYWDQRR